MSEKNSVIVLSGGMDSVTMLYEYADRIALAVNFSYGSNHNEREAACARWHCRKLGIELVEIDMSFIGENFHSSLLEGAEAIPEGDYDTLGGFIISLLDFLPQDGDMNEVIYENLKFTILDVEDRRIGKVRVEITSLDDNSSDSL